MKKATIDLELPEVMQRKPSDCVTNLFFQPQFIKGGRYFYYIREVLKYEKISQEHRIFDFETRKSSLLFSEKALLNSLEKQTGKKFRPGGLPFTLKKANENGDLVFEYQQVRYQWQEVQKRLTQLHIVSDRAALSPDGKYEVYLSNYNLFRRDLTTGMVKQLTRDGCQYYSYGDRFGTDLGHLTAKLKGEKTPVAVAWSKDSRYFVTYQMDERDVKDYYLLQTVPNEDKPARPILHQYKYSLPADEDANIPKISLFIHDVKKAKTYEWSLGKYIASVFPPIYAESREISFNEACTAFYTVIKSRDSKKVTYIKVELGNGEAQELFSEQFPCFYFNDFHSYNNYIAFDDENLKIVTPIGDDEFLFLSERDGYFHIYHYLPQNPDHPQQVTRGNWTVGKIVSWKREEGRVYFLAGGKEKNVNPYFMQLYSINLDGSGLRLHTEPVGTHQAWMPADGRYYIEACSSPTRPYQITIRSLDTGWQKRLLESDFTLLKSNGFELPEQFTIKAADGQTDLYGLILLPRNIKKGQKVPLVDCYYGAPQTNHVPWKFLQEYLIYLINGFAELGIAAMIMDGQGTPMRGRTFNSKALNNLGHCAGMEDHVNAYKQLNKKYPALDTNRIGVLGHSGGGYAVFKAMVNYPEVYKVGVSSAGNHVQELYIAEWSNRFMGLYDEDLWDAQNSEKDAIKLRGKLLLVHGELDENVHPANTMRVVNRLIKANKNFDMLYIPNANHLINKTPYFWMRILNYFSQNL